MTSGSNEWNAHLNGKTNQYNFSYRPAMTTPATVNTPPQMQQSTNKLVLPASTNKAVATANKTVSTARTNRTDNQNGSKKNQLPPPPSAMIVRGGKRKSKRKGRTHKKKRQY